MAQVQNTDNPKLMRMWSNTSPHSLLVGTQRGTDTLEDTVWQLSTKLNMFLPYDPTTALFVFTQVKNLCPHHNLHMNVYSNFMHNHPNLEAAQGVFQ